MVRDTKNACITLYDLTVELSGKTILSDISATVPAGSRIVLFGPSGSGKSTLLKTIAGLIQPASGELQGNCEKVSLVFQSGNLFEDLTCLENISYGLDVRKNKKKDILQKSEFWAGVFRCDSFLSQKCRTLSGGEKQRVSLARAFLKGPDLVMMDESFSALDAALRKELTEKVKTLQAEMGFTLIYVTHSLSEALDMAQELWLMKEGRLQKVLKSEDIEQIRLQSQLLKKQERELAALIEL